MGPYDFNAQLLASLPPDHPLQSALDPMAANRANIEANYGFLNPMAGQPPAPPANVQAPIGPPPPPPKAPPPAPMGIQASLPPPNRSEAGPMSVEPPPAAPPPKPQEPKPPPGPTLLRGAVSPAREVRVRGPQQESFLQNANEAEYQGARGSYEQKRQGLVEAEQAADMRANQAAQQLADAERGRQQFVQDSHAIRQDVDRLSADIAKGPAKPEEDPGRAFFDRISGALGAFAATLTGSGRNYAMEQINKRIDSEAEQRRAEWEAKKGQLGAKMSQFDMLANAYGASGAEAIWKAGLADRAAAQVDKKLAAAGITQMDASWADTAGALLARGEREKAAGVAFRQAGAQQNMVFDPELGAAVPYDLWVKDAMTRRLQREKGQAEGQDNVQQEVAHIARERQQAGIPQGTAAIQRAQADQAKAPEISSWKSLGQSVVNASALPKVLKQKALQALYSKEEAAREQSWSAVKNQYIHDVTGSGGSTQEMERIQEAAGQADADPEARARFLANMSEWYRERDRNIRSGASPAARKRFDEAMQNEGAPTIKERRY